MKQSVPFSLSQGNIFERVAPSRCLQFSASLLPQQPDVSLDQETMAATVGDEGHAKKPVEVALSPMYLL